MGKSGVPNSAGCGDQDPIYIGILGPISNDCMPDNGNSGPPNLTHLFMHATGQTRVLSERVMHCRVRLGARWCRRENHVMTPAINPFIDGLSAFEEREARALAAA
jgi:hypothetical protein